MTGPEKRYFKVFTARLAPGTSGDQHVLFDAIAAMTTYDEQALLEQLADRRSQKHFTTIKHRLYDAVLRSLSAFHVEGSIDARLARSMHQVEVLHDKALYEDAERLLNSARRLARSHDRQLVLLAIARWDQRLLERNNYALATKERMGRLLQDTEAAMAEQQELNALWEAKSKILLNLYRGGQARCKEALAEVRLILDRPLLHDAGELRTPRARFLFHHLHGAAAFATGDMSLCMEHLTRAIDTLEGSRTKFLEEPNLAISTLSNLIYVKVRMGHFEDAFALLSEFRSLPARWDMPETEDLDLKLFATSTSLELTIHSRMGAFDKALELIPVVERGMARHGRRLGPMRKAAFYYQLAYAYFGAGRPDLALRWSQRLLNDIHIDDSTEIVCFGRILNLMSHIDADKLDVVPYTLRNTGRFLATRARSHRFEPGFLAMVKGVLKARTPAALQGVYATFLEKITPLEFDPFEHVVFDHMDPIAWVESKLTGRPFAELVRERATRVAA
ncbi:MAG: hypothetical protein JNL43_12840 [Flavobacteriales bacterium]|nr:hypothetical protein [Flavobacteriales bacterium]